MPEFDTAVLRSVLLRIERQANAASRTGLIALGDAVVKQAKINASAGRHPYGTPTPARPGSGPAVISGTLRNSINRTAVLKSPFGWTGKVGIVPGKVPPYRKSGGATSSKYGLALETGLRNGSKFPFLEPATRLAHVQAVVVFRRVFAAIKWSAG